MVGGGGDCADIRTFVVASENLVGAWSAVADAGYFADLHVALAGC